MRLHIRRQLYGLLLGERSQLAVRVRRQLLEVATHDEEERIVPYRHGKGGAKAQDL